MRKARAARGKVLPAQRARNAAKEGRRTRCQIKSGNRKRTKGMDIEIKRNTMLSKSLGDWEIGLKTMDLFGD